MRNLIFIFRNDLLNFKVDGKNIYYNNKFWKKWIRCIPKDEELIKKIRMSRNKIPDVLAKMFNLSEKDQKEYDNADSEDELADIIIKDCKQKGLKLKFNEKCQT